MSLTKLTVLSATTFMLSAVSVPSIAELNNNVFADEIETKVTINERSPQSKLFKHAIEQQALPSKVNVFYEGDTKISQLLDQHMNVRAAEISNIKTSETISVVRTDTEVIVEKTTKGVHGTYDINTEHYPLATITDNIDAIINPMNHYTSWKYTNVAVGVNVFAAVTNLGISALITFTAGVFGIATAAADFLLEYMGAKGLPTGSALAAALDTSGNGWIGLYYREVWNDSQTVFYGTQHRTM